MSTLTIYTLSNCDTCRQAVKWLRAEGLNFQEKAIRETPPTMKELRAMLVAQHGELRRLFNTSGRDYRDQGLEKSLPTMTEDEALGLLAGNGNLVKRPFLLGPGVGLVGFDDSVWRKVLVSK